MRNDRWNERVRFILACLVLWIVRVHLGLVLWIVHVHLGLVLWIVHVHLGLVLWIVHVHLLHKRKISQHRQVLYW